MTLRFPLFASLAACVLATSGALAQETAPADNTAPQPGQPYLAATFQDWQIVCTPGPEQQPEACEMYQLLVDTTQSPIAEISIAALPFGSEFSAGATVTTPLETFLPTGLGFRIGEAETMRIEPFRVCTVVGCIVRMGVTADEVDALKAGTTATLTIAPFIAVDQPVDIRVSLSGFTAAYDDLQTRLAAAIAASRAAGQ